MGVHHFTVDVEDYFQVSAFEGLVDRRRWDSFESRVHIGVDRVLSLLDDRRALGTFFTLGWIAERHPLMIKRIAEAGHEIASHGWGHRRVTTLSPSEFRESVRRSKHLLEDVTGVQVIGYRAPSFSIVQGREWALEVLVEEGYRYDSSLFPVRRRGYGYPSGRRDVHVLPTGAGHLVEIPPTTLRRFGQNLPAAGGAYFRLFPYGVIRQAFRDAERANERGTFYIHPWELDPDQPRLPVGRLRKIRHYGGLVRTVPRLRRLLSEFEFTSIRNHPTLATPDSD